VAQRAASRMSRSAGFTLIELMVVVIIATILLSIAIPAYTSQIRKSRRTEARTAVLDLASREERFFSTSAAYTSSAANLGYAAFPAQVGSNYYQVNVCSPACNAGGPAAPSFSVTATPVAGNGQDKDTQCVSFTVDSTGRQAALDSSSTDSTATCW